MGLNASRIVLQYRAVVNVVSWRCRIRRASRYSGLGCRNTVIKIYVSSKNRNARATNMIDASLRKSKEARAQQNYLLWEAMGRRRVMMPWHDIVRSGR